MSCEFCLVAQLVADALEIINPEGVTVTHSERPGCGRVRLRVTRDDGPPIVAELSVWTVEPERVHKGGAR